MNLRTVILFASIGLFLSIGVKDKMFVDGKDFKWKKRALIITDNAPEVYERQVVIAKDNGEAFAERKIVVLKVPSDHPLISPYSENYVFLVGLDGEVKKTSKTEMSAKELFQTIDSMPIRKDEIE